MPFRIWILFGRRYILKATTCLYLFIVFSVTTYTHTFLCRTHMWFSYVFVRFVPHTVIPTSLFSFSLFLRSVCTVTLLVMCFYLTHPFICTNVKLFRHIKEIGITLYGECSYLIQIQYDNINYFSTITNYNYIMISMRF